MCTNRRTVKLTDLEGRVLEALRKRLKAPDVYAAFVLGTSEWNAEQKGRGVEQEGHIDELKRLDRKIGNLVSAVADSGGSAAILTALTEAEARKTTLESQLAVADDRPRRARRRCRRGQPESEP